MMPPSQWKGRSQRSKNKCPRQLCASDYAFAALKEVTNPECLEHDFFPGEVGYERKNDFVDSQHLVPKNLRNTICFRQNLEIGKIFILRDPQKLAEQIQVANTKGWKGEPRGTGFQREIF